MMKETLFTRHRSAVEPLMDGEAGWWTTGGKIGIPPLARVMGVGGQQQQETMAFNTAISVGFGMDLVQNKCILASYDFRDHACVS